MKPRIYKARLIAKYIKSDGQDGIYVMEMTGGNKKWRVQTLREEFEKNYKPEGIRDLTMEFEHISDRY